MNSYTAYVLIAFFAMIVAVFFIAYLIIKKTADVSEGFEHNPLDDFKIATEEFDGYDLNFWKAQMIETHKDPSTQYNCDCCGRSFSKDNADDEFTREIVYSLTCKSKDQTVTKRARFHLCMHCYWYHFLRRTDKIMKLLVSKALRFGSREV